MLIKEKCFLVENFPDIQKNIFYVWKTPLIMEKIFLVEKFPESLKTFLIMENFLHVENFLDNWKVSAYGILPWSWKSLWLWKTFLIMEKSLFVERIFNQVFWKWKTEAYWRLLPTSKMESFAGTTFNCKLLLESAPS